MRKKLMEKGLKLLEQGQYEEATHALSVLVQNYPDCADGHHLLGIIALEMGNYEEAYLFVHTSLSLSPNNSIYYTTMGNVQLHRQNFTEAADAFVRAVENDPERIEYRSNLANFYLAKGDYPRAIENYNKILKINPDHYLSIRGKTICFLFAGEHKPALAVARSWSESYEMQHEPHYILGLCLYANKLFSEALANFDTALEIYPNHHEVVTAIGACYNQLGNHNLAETFLHRSLSLEANNPSALYLLTGIKYIQGEHKAAKDLFLNAVRLDVEFPVIAMQNVEDAVQHYTTTQQKDPLFFLKCSGSDYIPMLSSGL